MPNTVTLSGWKEGAEKLKNMPQILFEEIDAECGAAAEEWHGMAVQSAPEDFGFLINKISFKQNGLMNWDVISASEYSAFIEWGTKGRVNIPSDLASYAAQFKGISSSKGGKGFYDTILEWVKRKKIGGTYSVKTHRRLGNKIEKQIEDEQIAFAIYLSIIRHGIHAHPFFFIHKPTIEKNLITHINNILKTEH